MFRPSFAARALPFRHSRCWPASANCPDGLAWPQLPAMENITLFAQDVEAATGGKLKITVHANASLFKAPEIKRAVQGSQRPGRRDPAGATSPTRTRSSALDGRPFLATTLPRIEEALRRRQAARWRSCWPRKGIKVL